MPDLVPDPVSPLAGRQSRSFVTVRDAGPVGMVTLRGDLGSEVFQRTVGEVAGVFLPEQGRIAEDGDRGLAWMSPDELLLILPHAEAAGVAERLSEAMSGEHFMAVEVSDARAVIAVEGAGLREVLAKLSPVDMHPDAFPVGRMRRTHLGEVAAAFWLSSEDRATVICFRSVADYAFGLLAQSAKDGPVGVF